MQGAALDGAIILWFILTALSLIFIVVDIRNTPEEKVLKWGFILLTAYIGPFGVFLYVLGCREPLPGLHEKYIASRWRQVLGSTMHCVAGDGLGILAGAAIGALIHLGPRNDLILEYLLGFGFGWTIFQSLAMKNMLGTYAEALKKTFYAEFVSMNLLMAGMVPTMMISMRNIAGADDPTGIRFWFVMSYSLLVGFIFAYPINWWLVSRNLKHGMMTIRKNAQKDSGGHSGHSKPQHQHGQGKSEDSHSGHSQKHANNDEHSEHSENQPTTSLSYMLSIAVFSIVVMAIGIYVGFTF